MMALLALLLLPLGLAAFIRLAPTDAARWHADPASEHRWAEPAPFGTVIARRDGAILRLPASAETLARLDTIARATPRTTRLMGTPQSGRITWITRSAFWGFPDYTTAALRPDGLYLDARLRFGRSDLGVNAARLRDWLSRLPPSS